MKQNQFLLIGLGAALLFVGAAFVILSPSPEERLAQAVSEGRWSDVEQQAQVELEKTQDVEKQADFYDLLGRAYKEQGKNRLAFDAYMAASERRTSEPELRRRAAIELVKVGHKKSERGEPEAGIETYREAIELAPLIPQGHRALVAALREQYNLEEAIVALEAAMQTIPQDVKLRLQLAWLLASHPDPEIRNPYRAVELANDILLHDRTPETLDTFAVALASAGDFKQAIRFELDAIDLAGGEEAPLFEDRRKRVGRFLKDEPYIEQPAPITP